MSATPNGPQLLLPPSVSADVRTQFGRHCQQLDDLFGGLDTSREQLALAEFMAAHLSAQITMLRLALDGAKLVYER